MAMMTSRSGTSKGVLPVTPSNAAEAVRAQSKRPANMQVALALGYLSALQETQQPVPVAPELDPDLGARFSRVRAGLQESLEKVYKELERKDLCEKQWQQCRMKACEIREVLQKVESVMQENGYLVPAKPKSTDRLNGICQRS